MAESRSAVARPWPLFTVGWHVDEYVKRSSPTRVSPVSATRGSRHFGSYYLLRLRVVTFDLFDIYQIRRATGLLLVLINSLPEYSSLYLSGGAIQHHPIFH